MNNMNILRKRLTGLYTATTGGILFLVLAVLFLSSLRENRNAQQEQFLVVWNSLSFRFQTSNAFSHGFLAQTEINYHMIIHIRENGNPFLYQGSWKPDTDRHLLIDRAIAQAEEEGVFMDRAPISSTSSTTSLMTIQGDHHDHYYAMVLVLSAPKGVKSICAISYIPSAMKSLGRTILRLCILAVLGIACLWYLSWKFVGWSLKSVEESRKKQARFIAAASHELRSPLAVLRSATTAISSSPEKKDTLLPLIDSECVRMSRLIDDMLLLASADAKTWSLQPKHVDMDTLLIDLFETFQPVYEEKGISLYLELPDTVLPAVWGDPERIRQIFVVLLDNAGTYTPLGHSVRICCQISEKKQMLSLQVIDEGCGIPAEHKPYIFDRFYQADPARTSKQHFGLGLSIAKELVQLHHGTITISDNPGGGSCFTVSLPYLPSART